MSRRIPSSLIMGLLSVGVVAASPEPRIEGWVRFASGQAAPGVQVRLFQLADLSRSLGVITDEEGFFSLPAAPLAGQAGTPPRQFELFQNHPNPFNPSTSIPYRLPAPANVRLEVFNLLGQQVATLVDEEQQAGLHTATWNGTDAAGRPVAAGLYLYRIWGGGVSQTRRMVLLDGAVTVSGGGTASGTPAGSETPGQVYGLTVSGPGVIAHVDPDFRVRPGPVEIVVEARAEARGGAAMKAAVSGTRILGDVDANGRVDLFDMLLVRLYSMDPSIALPDGGNIFLGDVNSDGRVDIADVTLIVTYRYHPAHPSLPAGIGAPLVAVAGGKMYWVDQGSARIQRANLDGSGVEDLVAAGLKEPTDLALDVAGDKMYWTEWGGDGVQGKIRRANLNGSQVEDLATGGKVLTLALDLARGKVYWACEAKGSLTGTIQRANLDGSDVEDLLTTGFIHPWQLALDIAGGKMYWVDLATHKIQRANLDGSGLEGLISTSLWGPWGLELDLASGRMYWTEVGLGRIRRSNLNGSHVKLLLERPASRDLVLVSPEGKMYWTEGSRWEEGSGRILRANLAGSQVEELATGLHMPRGLALDLSGLPEVSVNRPPVLDVFGRQSVEEGEILRIDLAARDPEGAEVDFEARSNVPGVAAVRLSGGRLEIIPQKPGIATVTVTASDASGASTTQDFWVTVTEPVPESRGRMYWTDRETDRIRRANLDGSQAEDFVATGAAYTLALALDLAGGKLYWTQGRPNKIRRANLDGSQIEDLVTVHSGLGWAASLALDVAGGEMYWTEPGLERIMRSKLDGSAIESILDRRAWGIRLDLAEGKIYWADTNHSRVERSNLDGSDAETLVTPRRNPVTWLNSPRGLVLDLAAGKMYWVDPGMIRIQRANLDGSQVENVIVSGLGYPRKGIALDPYGGKLYWTDWGAKKIQRSNLDGTRVEDLVTGLDEPMGLALEIFPPDL